MTLTGLVTKVIGNHCWVYITALGETYECLIKGNVRIKGIRTTNPVVVGDEVSFTPDTRHGISYIQRIEPRRNYIIRRAANLSKEAHVLAANIDQALLLITVARPHTSYTFVDRFLATAEAYDIPVHLVFNKIDDVRPEEKATLQEFIDIYRPLGYPCHTISALHRQGTDMLYSLLEDKKTLLSGHSGTGKSTLMNTLLPRLHLATQQISEQHETGQHTTTYSEMYALPAPHHGWIIDTPGIKGFGTIEMQETDTAHYFRELFAYSKECRFSNCTHLHEPGCAVLAALEEGKIAPSRYKSYLSILGDEEEGPYRLIL